jgi:putative acetyltransferase
MEGMIITIDKFEDEGIIKLLEEHLADMHANSPPESVHALDVEALKSPLITFWSARENTEVLGCIALKELTPGEGEINAHVQIKPKSRRGFGVAQESAHRS